MRVLAFLACLALAAPAAAQPEWRQAREYEVLLSSFDIQPDPIRLKAGEPLRLRLTNNSTIAHSFNSEAFFAKAEVRARSCSCPWRAVIRPVAAIFTTAS
jgi:hypothetical protein